MEGVGKGELDTEAKKSEGTEGEKVSPKQEKEEVKFIVAQGRLVNEPKPVTSENILPGTVSAYTAPKPKYPEQAVVKKLNAPKFKPLAPPKPILPLPQVKTCQESQKTANPRPKTPTVPLKPSNVAQPKTKPYLTPPVVLKKMAAKPPGRPMKPNKGARVYKPPVGRPIANQQGCKTCNTCTQCGQAKNIPGGGMNTS